MMTPRRRLLLLLRLRLRLRLRLHRRLRLVSPTRLLRLISVGNRPAMMLP